MVLQSNLLCSYLFDIAKNVVYYNDVIYDIQTLFLFYFPTVRADGGLFDSFWFEVESSWIL